MAKPHCSRVLDKYYSKTALILLLYTIRYDNNPSKWQAPFQNFPLLSMKTFKYRKYLANTTSSPYKITQLWLHTFLSDFCFSFNKLLSRRQRKTKEKTHFKLPPHTRECSTLVSEVLFTNCYQLAWRIFSSSCVPEDEWTEIFCQMLSPGGYKLWGK